MASLSESQEYEPQHEHELENRHEHEHEHAHEHKEEHEHAHEHRHADSHSHSHEVEVPPSCACRGSSQQGSRATNCCSAIPKDSIIVSKAPSLKLRNPDWDLEPECNKHDKSLNGEYCKDMSEKDERHLISPDVVRDAIIGLSDGLTVPFALTAGLSSLGNSKIVVLGGVAELIAGTISMGVGGFLASQSERHHYFYRLAQISDRVKRTCSGQMSNEVHEILGPVGVSEKVSRQVAVDLLKYHGPEGGNNNNGLSTFFSKFGEQLEEKTWGQIFATAFTIGAGYLIGGLIPLFPYFFIHQARDALLWSSVVTGITLLIFGVIKTYVTGAKGGIGGYLWGAISTLCVGGGAAAAAYGIVLAINHAQ